jgi:hypothetical protein
VTRVVTEGFGTKQDEPVATEFELRASWSPAPSGAVGAAGADTGTAATGAGPAGVDAAGTAADGTAAASGLGIDGHAAAWCDALCAAAGLPPLVAGVSALAPPRRRRPT